MYYFNHYGLIVSCIILLLGFFLGYMAIGKPRFMIPRQHYTLGSKIYLITWIFGFLLLSIIPLDISRIGTQTHTYSPYAIQIFLDVSLSMTASDIQPSRFSAAKEGIIGLYDMLPIHYFSLIPFSGIPFVWIPYSQDSYGIGDMLDKLQLGNFPPLPEFVGTAIGDALLLGVAKAQNLPDTVQPIFVLITDGDSNRGYDPDQVIPILQQLTIPVYTLAFAKDNFLIGEDRAGNEITTAVDLSLLETISTQTQGKFFHIKDIASMREAFAYINDIVERDTYQETIQTTVPYNRYLWIILLMIASYISLYQGFIIWRAHKQ